MGVLGYYLIPLVLGAIAPGKVPVQHYIGTSLGLLGRALAIKRKHGGWWLKKSSFDAKYGKERTSINGETQHFDDPESLMSRMYGWPFGVAHEKSGTITTPRYAELGEVLRDRVREGSLFYEHDGETYVNGYVRVADDDDRLVNIDHALALMTGDAQPNTTDWAEEITVKSQSVFESGNLVDYVGGLAAFGVAFGAVWFATQVGSNGGSGGSTISIGMVDLMHAGVQLL